MLNIKKCSIYRSSEGVGMGKGLGFCEFDGSQAVCDGDIQFCKKPDALSKYFLDPQGKEKRSSVKENLTNLNGLKALDMKSSHYKVLIVDDEEPIKKLIVTLLSRKGHQCVTASNGLEALDRTKGNSFDAVVTDIIMPEMDGIALTKALLKHNQNLPIMIMTGHTDQYSAEIAIVLGAREFVSKPFSVEEFILRFHKMMYDHKVLREIETKKNAIIFNSQKESTEKIRVLEREIELLKGRLSSKYLDY